MTKVINCNCDSKYQDQKYGKNKRLANQTAKSFRCTVCGKDEK